MLMMSVISGYEDSDTARTDQRKIGGIVIDVGRSR